MIEHKTIKANLNSVKLGNVTIFFSYETPIGIKYDTDIFMAKNGSIAYTWNGSIKTGSKTTAKHISIIKREYENCKMHTIEMAELITVLSKFDKVFGMDANALFHPID